MVYDEALNKLAYTESQLKRAINDVYKRLPPETLRAAGAQVVSDQVAAAPDSDVRPVLDPNQDTGVYLLCLPRR